MSGPDGGEHPLDVDARFADIIAHFDDDEPVRPTVVDGFDGPTTDGATDGTTDGATDGAMDGTGDGTPAGDDATGAGPDAARRTSAGPAAAPTVGPDQGLADARRPDTAKPDNLKPDILRPDSGRPDATATGRSGPDVDPVRDLAAPADLAAMRRSYEARIAAEVDRAVDGADGGHFVPADPPPLPRPDLPGRLAWTAVLAGPVLLLLCALLWRSAPSWLLGTIVTAVVVGFGYLVWRLPRTRDRDDPGDGAIV